MSAAITASAPALGLCHLSHLLYGSSTLAFPLFLGILNWSPPLTLSDEVHYFATGSHGGPEVNASQLVQCGPEVPGSTDLLPEKPMAGRGDDGGLAPNFNGNYSTKSLLSTELP